jgi:tRNA synthetases class I (W and Y)
MPAGVDILVANCRLKVRELLHTKQRYASRGAGLVLARRHAKTFLTFASINLSTTILSPMRASFSSHARAMKARWRGALIQSRGLAVTRQLLDGSVDGARSSSAFRKRIKEPKEPVVFSGIQPTGIPHLGNYLGALRPWVELQNSRKENNRCLYCVVDLHALTIPQNAEHLAQWRKESFASLLAIGLKPDQSVIFMQSDVRLLSVKLDVTDSSRRFKHIRS